MIDRTKPELRKIGCYTYGGRYPNGGFTFFDIYKPKANDIFIYKRGVIWMVKK